MCQDHLVLGSVRGAGGLPAPSAAVLLSSLSPASKLLTLTDHNGHFRVPGLCPDGNTTLTVLLEDHSPHTVTVPLSSEHTSVLSVQLQRAGIAAKEVERMGELSACGP